MELIALIFAVVFWFTFWNRLNRIANGIESAVAILERQEKQNEEIRAATAKSGNVTQLLIDELRRKAG